MKLLTLTLVSILSMNVFAGNKFMSKKEEKFKNITSPMIATWEGKKDDDKNFKSVTFEIKWSDALDSDQQQFVITYVVSADTIKSNLDAWKKEYTDLKNVTSYTIKLEGIWDMQGRGRDGAVPFLYLKDLTGAVKIEGEGDLVGVNTKENGKLKANLKAKEGGDNLRGKAFGFLAKKVTSTEEYFFPKLQGFIDFDVKINDKKLELKDHSDEKSSYTLTKK
jgi:hypothetical protein